MTKYLLFFFLGSSLLSVAQDDAKIVRYNTSVILSSGVNVYSGDVCKICLNTGYQFEASSRVLMYKKFFFRPAFAFQRIQANNDPVTELSFKNNLLSASLTIEYAPFAEVRSFGHRSSNELFLSIAPVLSHHNPFTTIEGKKTYLAGLQTEANTYSKFVLGAKLGVFANFELKKNTKLGFSIDYLVLFSDYVDDVSGDYIDYSKTQKTRALAIDPTQKATVGSTRGNDKPFDSLLRFSISYEFNFERKIEVYE